MSENKSAHDEFTTHYRQVGKTVAWAVFLLGVVYALVTVLGFLSLASPQTRIGYPYVTTMELLVVPLATLYLVVSFTRPSVSSSGVFDCVVREPCSVTSASRELSTETGCI